MTRLAFDTSTADVVVGVQRDDGTTAESRAEPESGGRPRHTTALLPAIEDLVEANGGWASIDRIVVGIGPGGFTGLRVGVTTARALAGAHGLPVRVVSGLNALLAGAARGQLGADGDVQIPQSRIALIDAKRGELFAARSGQPGEPSVITPEQLAAELSGEGGGSMAFGDGAIRFRGMLEEAGAVVPQDQDPLHRIATATMFELAEVASDLAPAEVKPVYLRRPDAEIWLERDSPKH